MTDMPHTKGEILLLKTEDDIVRVRQMVRVWMMEEKFSLILQTKMVTAASELARNTVIHGGGGFVKLEHIENESEIGIRATFEDQGPGISDMTQAMRDGFTTGNGLGLGLGGSKRLVHDFQIYSEPGNGTRIIITMYM